MNDTSLYNFIEERLAWEIGPYDEVNVGRIADDLADGLKSRGYCSEPYLEYEKALMCPINKRKEKYCGCTQCKSHDFCILLRREGYINV